ncbi:MAG: hypothetical protein OIF57_14380 [Marinobacterium sp.]|nr:hypothetical protein [Marinobacterium sp.]
MRYELYGGALLRCQRTENPQAVKFKARLQYQHRNACNANDAGQSLTFTHLLIQYQTCQYQHDNGLK